MRSGLRTMAIVFLCVACKATALAQNLPTNAVQDYRWISGTASAALVLAPPKLTGVTRWTIESRRHRGIIWAAAQSPDGKLLAAGGVDGVVRIWHLETGCLDRAIMADRFGLASMAWSPDGAKLATIG